MCSACALGDPASPLLCPLVVVVVAGNILTICEPTVMQLVPQKPADMVVAAPSRILTCVMRW
eukprot:4366204-Pyramimonas_sp.AAC.1